MKISPNAVKQFLLVTALTILGLMVVNALSLPVASAQAIDATQDQPEIIRGLSGGQTGLRGIVLTIINFFLGFLGLLAVVMIIYGGFLYVSSAGNEENVGKAKKILIYAAIGIILIIASFALVNTILTAGTAPRGS